MSAADAHQLLNPPVPISCFSFNRDRSMVAVCPNSNAIEIYKKGTNGEWEAKPLFTLLEHDKLVTGIDWAPESNRIVSCSQDRNAYVWSFVPAANGEPAKWSPTLVLLRIDRAATQVKWSPKEDKFACGSGDRCISICYYDKDNDWWVAKHVRKSIKSTVLSIDWHPNNVLLAAGSAEFRARVFVVAIKGVDSKPTPTNWGSSTSFGDCLVDIDIGNVGGWVHDIAFSPDGESLAFVGHGSHLTVVHSSAIDQPQYVRCAGLPFRALLWVTPKSIVAAGHDNNPILFSETAQGWERIRELDAGKVEAAKATSARSVFLNMDTKGATEGESKLKTLHQNAISGLAPFKGAAGAVQQFASAGVDGQIIIWDVKSLESSLAGLKII